MPNRGWRSRKQQNNLAEHVNSKPCDKSFANDAIFSSTMARVHGQLPGASVTARTVTDEGKFHSLTQKGTSVEPGHSQQQPGLYSTIKQIRRWEAVLAFLGPSCTEYRHPPPSYTQRHSTLCREPQQQQQTNTMHRHQHFIFWPDAKPNSALEQCWHHAGQ